MVVHGQTPQNLTRNNKLYIIGQVTGRNEHTGKKKPQNNRKQPNNTGEIVELI